MRLRARLARFKRLGCQRARSTAASLPPGGETSYSPFSVKGVMGIKRCIFQHDASMKGAAWQVSAATPTRIGRPISCSLGVEPGHAAIPGQEAKHVPLIHIAGKEGHCAYSRNIPVGERWGARGTFAQENAGDCRGHVPAFAILFIIRFPES